MPEQPEQPEHSSRFRAGDIQTRAMSSFASLDDLTVYVEYLLSRFDAQAAQVKAKAALAPISSDVGGCAQGPTAIKQKYFYVSCKCSSSYRRNTSLFWTTQRPYGRWAHSLALPRTGGPIGRAQRT